MNKAELSELKARIAAKMDITQFLDVLGYTMEDVVDLLEDSINKYSDEFEEALD
jgi:hypothetical protein